MDRAEKKAEVEYLSDCFRRSQAALCADYHGLTVADITALRRDLHQSGSVSRVVKNTLAKISARQAFQDAKQTELEKFLSILDGPSFLVLSFSDPVAPAKIVAKFVKERKKLKVKGGWVDGAFVDAAAVESLALMPGKREVLSMLLGLIKAPAGRLVKVLQAPAEAMARLIQAQAKELEGKN